MSRKIFLPVIFVLLAYGFWQSSDFQQIAAGVAVFLFGMLALEEGFKAFTGGTLEDLLRRTTDGLWKSLGFGILTTTVMQSSSLVSVITISFLSAGLIGLAAGIGIIFGANLGTTTGAWLVAGFGLKVKIAAYAMPMLVFGIILLFQRSKTLKGIGYTLMGLGFLFLGIHYMKEGFEAFGTSFDLAAYAVPGLRGLLLYTAIGIAATVVMQSSHATLVLTITALASQQLTYENALALAIGANVGTTITAILGSMGANIDGKRLAAAHLLFNLTTGLVAILLLRQLLWAVDFLSAAAGIAPDDHTLKLAVFHTLFNLLGIVLMIPFIPRMVSLLERFVKVEEGAIDAPRYINESALEVPAAAVEATRKEIRHLYQNAFEIIARGLALKPEVIDSNRDLARAVAETSRIEEVDIDALYEQRIKGLHSAIVEFISRVQSQELPEHWANELYNLREASRDIVEAVKETKHMHKNLKRFAASAHSDIRRQYDTLRLELGTILREVGELASGVGDVDTILSLDGAKVRLEETDRRINVVLPRLIRDKRVTAHMATSLMNDCAYAYEIGKHLVDMAQTLFAVGERKLKAAEDRLKLDEADIDKVIRARR
jgi:phosphate:Na+ symporter